MTTKYILGVKISSTSKQELLALLDDKLTTGRKFYVLTPNPEIIVMAQKDKDLKAIINTADLSIPDGVGLKLADPSLEIIKGRELMQDLINTKKYKIFSLGSEGPRINNDGNPVSEVDRLKQIEIVKKINKQKPDILFVGMGSPKEQKWIAKNLSKLNVKMAMQVGGAIDFVAQRRKTPSWMQNNLEWLWRLIREPKRLKRIINAVVVFPLLLLTSRLKGD